MDLSQMSPRRPFILRAFYEWLLDNDLTPYLVVDVTLPGVQVPMEHARDGQIILNIAPQAVGNLELGNDEIHFNARFSGTPRKLIIPLYAVLAIYARENGAGTLFEAEPAYHRETLFPVENQQPDPDDDPPRPKGGRPTLRVVK